MKKIKNSKIYMFIITLLITVFACAVVQAEEVISVQRHDTANKVVLAKEHKAKYGIANDFAKMIKKENQKVFVQTFSLKKGEEEKGGKLVQSKFCNFDGLVGAAQITSSNKKVEGSVATPLSNLTYISQVIADKDFATQMHIEMVSANQKTKAKGKGQIFRWGAEDLIGNDRQMAALKKLGFDHPVKMTIIAFKEKDKESNIIKGLKAAVAGVGIWKTAKDWNNEYMDLNGLLTSALMLQSLSGGGNTISPLAGQANLYAVETTQLCGGF